MTERTRIWNRAEPELMPRHNREQIEKFKKSLKPGDRIWIKIKHHMADEIVAKEHLAEIKGVFPHVIQLEYMAMGRPRRTTYKLVDLAFNLVEWRFSEKR